MNRILLAILSISLLSAPAICQEPDRLLPRPAHDSLLALPASHTMVSQAVVDSTAFGVKGDTAVFEPDFSHSPSRAIMYALALPGLGQGYNQKYFKIPIVLAALGGAGYAISFNTKKYQYYSKELASNPGEYTEDYLKYWRRNMELSYIAMIAVYALQVVDAYVDAQLYSWDVNDNLSMGISPSLQPLMAPGSMTGYSYGLTCSFNLRRK